jgi:hypothetical protein
VPRSSATNDGEGVSAPESVAVLLAARWVKTQANASGPPSASLDWLPSSVTVAPVATAWSGPAFATGGRLIEGAVALLLARLGSGWRLPVIDAVRSSGPVALTRAPTTRPARTPAGNGPARTQSPVPAS